MSMNNGSLMDVANISPGDEIKVQGEWLDVYDRSLHGTGRIVLRTDDGRTFLTTPGHLHRIRKAPPVKPTVSKEWKHTDGS